LLHRKPVLSVCGAIADDINKDMESETAVTVRTRAPLRLPGVMPSALLPRAVGLRPVPRRLAQVSMAVLALSTIVDFLHAVLGLAPRWESALNGPYVAAANLVCAGLVLAGAAAGRAVPGAAGAPAASDAPGSRLIRWLPAAGISSYAVADVLWHCWLQYQPDPPSPSVADVFWLGMYPLVGAAIVLALRADARRLGSRRLLIDGLVAATAAIAICAAFIVPPLLHAAQRDHGALVMDLLYPVADMVIGILAVGLLSIRSWHMDRTWGLLITAFALWLLGDSTWALQISTDAATASSVVNLCYVVAFVLVAVAAWQKPGPATADLAAAPDDAPQVAGREAPAVAERAAHPSFAIPALLGLAPPAILLYDHFSQISLTALVLTWIALLAAIARVAVAMRDTLMLRDAQRAAHTDELTGLPNRRMFLTRLQHEFQRANREGGSLTALMLDLDNFKQLNDTLGHDAGDELLRLTGPRLAQAAGPHTLVARLGGDEFALLLQPNCSRADAGAVAQRLIDSFALPLRVHGLALRLTGSVGIACFPSDAEGPETLLKRADIAMYEAKRSRHGWEYYSAERDVNTLERLEMTGELAHALESEQIEVAFQAIADTDTRLIRGAEALVRWRRPDGTLRPPAEFLEAAELAGLSRQLTRRVLQLALDNLCAWRAAGHIISVSVNTTVADLLDDAFPEEIANALETRGLRGEALKIEVTESSIMANPGRVGEVLSRVRALGVKIALDDFGTGYSSLTHLRELPVDRLKIDRSFVTHMRCEPTDAAIVYATIELAHKLDMKVIAEGVEDDATWQALLELECDAVQGYVLNQPSEPAAFRALLTAQGTTPATDRDDYLADSQSLPTPASTASGGSIA